MNLFAHTSDLADVARLKPRSHGVIETARGRLVRITLRPFPKFVSPVELLCAGDWYHRQWPGDRCRLYFNEPRRTRGYLTLKYVVSSRATRLATFRLALRVLDELARIKLADAIVCDAANLRISDRLLARWGWEPHCASRWHRHHIKRFYGVYPAPLALELNGAPARERDARLFTGELGASAP